MNRAKKIIKSTIVVVLALAGGELVSQAVPGMVQAKVSLSSGVHHAANDITCKSPNGPTNREDKAKKTDTLNTFSITLPDRLLPLPTPIKQGDKQGFTIRGMKGYCWTPQQYLEEIPVLAKYKANFLMNCYLSMFSVKDKLVYRFGTFLDSLENDWWKPLLDKKRLAYEQIFRECRKYHLNFCFAMNPQLFSKRPLNPESEADFNSLWKHYEWAQQQGVRWFSVCLDDVQEGDVSIVGAEHARFTNKLLNRLRLKDPGAQLIFCPTWYWGTGTDVKHHAYLEELANILHPDIYLFWTGPQVVPTFIHTEQAVAFKQIIHHRLILWENYPVNDNHPTMHLGPITGRDKDLCTVIDGYMVNPMGTQNQINRIPLLTCLDYAYNPSAYNPERSIGQSILHLAGTRAQQEIFKRMVETYPGSLILRSDSSDRGLVSLNPVRYRFESLIRNHSPKDNLERYLSDYEKLVRDFTLNFPNQFPSAKITLQNDIQWMKQKKIGSVKKELYVASPAPGEGISVSMNYIGRGLRREETRAIVRTSDLSERPKRRISSDNGRTWSEWEIIDEKAKVLGNCTMIGGANQGGTGPYDPVSNRLIKPVFQRIIKGNPEVAYREIWKGNRLFCDHGFYQLSADDGLTWGEPRQLKYEEGPDFDPANWDEPGYSRSNEMYIGNAIVLKNGTVAISATIPVPFMDEEDKNAPSIFPNNYREGCVGGAVCFIGKWDQTLNDYKWKVSKPVYLPRRISSRGLDELDICQLSNGNLLLNMRGSNSGLDPLKCPGRRWYSLSSDGGLTWSEVLDFRYDTGEQFYSPASIAYTIRSSKNGKLYWVGNISDKPVEGNSPRYPLQIIEIDENRICFRKETITTIDDRDSECDAENVQLSNFSIFEDRETHDIELYLIRLGEKGGGQDMWTANSYKYTLSL